MDFVSMFRNHRLHVYDVEAFFIVVALFTSVPRELAVEVAVEKLGRDPTWEERIPIGIGVVVTLLRFCLK